MPNSSLALAPANEPDRIHGWKEIATYLGRGVRTVQRWEVELGLPVYRFVTKGSEVVYAKRSELDAWLNSTDRTRVAARSEPAREPSLLRRQVTRLDLGVAALAIAVFVVLLMGYANDSPLPLWPFGSGKAQSEPPVSGRFDHQRLQAFDALGNPAWEHTFDFPIDEGVYRTGFLADGQSPSIVVDDVNADGLPEVMLVPWAADPANRRLYCFTADGTILFAAPALGATLGRLAGRMQEFSAGRFIVTGEANGAKSIWLSVPHAYRPETIVQRLDGRGRVTSEYASHGAVTLLKALTVNDRRLLMVGGTSADLQEATLAMLDYADAAGADPTRAQEASARCEGCSTAGPIAFLAFPRLDVSTAVARPPLVTSVQLRGDGGLDVSVLQARIGISSDRPFMHAAVVYSFSSDLRLEAALATEGYLLAHSELQLAGSIAHPYGDEDRRTMVPVHAWTGSGFAPVSIGARVPLTR
jgi:hypothetical protein